MSSSPSAPLSIICAALILAGCDEGKPGPVGPEATLEPAGPTQSAAIARNTWVRFADLPTPRRGAAMAAVPKANGTSRLFAIAGGLRRERMTGTGSTFIVSVPVGTVTEYLPNQNRWARRADAPYVWQQVPQAGVIDGKIYLPGGLTGHGELRFATRTMAVYNVATNTWSTVDMPQYMTAQTVWTRDGALYVFGRCMDEETWEGEDMDDSCRETSARAKFLLRYTPSTNRWTYLANPTVEPRANPVSGTIGGKAYVTAGGSDALDSYDPATRVWRGWNPLDRARRGAAGDAVMAKLYVVGGQMLRPDGEWGQSRALSEYTPASNSWDNRAQVPQVFAWGIRATRVMLGGQARLAILGDWGTHYQWAP